MHNFTQWCLWHHSHSENFAPDRPIIATNIWYADTIHSLLFRLFGLKLHYKWWNTRRQYIDVRFSMGNMHNFTQWCHMASFTFREFCSPQTYCSNKYLVCRHNTLTSFQAAWLKTYKTYKNYKTFKSSFLKVMKHQNTVQDFRFSTEICTVLPHDVIWHHWHSENFVAHSLQAMS